MSEHKIKILLNKQSHYGRDLYYINDDKDKWLTNIYNQSTLTKDNINYLKSTGHFEFELIKEDI